MELSRRDFLKTGGAGVGGLFVWQTLSSGKAGASSGRYALTKQLGECTTICPYDASGCGFIVATENGKVVNIEGDPEHP